MIKFKIQKLTSVKQQKFGNSFTPYKENNTLFLPASEATVS